MSMWRLLFGRKGNRQGDAADGFETPIEGRLFLRFLRGTGAAFTVDDLCWAIASTGLSAFKNADQWPDRFGRYHVLITADTAPGAWSPLLTVEMAHETVHTANLLVYGQAASVDECSTRDVVDGVKRVFRQAGWSAETL
jgi:hypothetical protein